MGESQEDLAIDGVENAVEIGRGGFGVVYKAWETELGREVAVKILTGELDERSRVRFERERLAMGALSSHPNIITVFRTGISDSGGPFLVMEYLSGGSLADNIGAKGPMGPEATMRIGVELCGALETAHRAGVLHRDVKPGNIIMDNLGRSKLGDFGIARLHGGPETKSSVITASVAHAPPEVIAGKRPDERADVYSLASTLYELTTGMPAFARDTDESMVPMFARIVGEPLPDLRATGTPDLMATVLEKAMAKDPSQRYGSAAEFGRALIDAQRAMGLSPGSLLIEGEPRTTDDHGPQTTRHIPNPPTPIGAPPPPGAPGPPAPPQPPGSGIQPPGSGSQPPGPGIQPPGSGRQPPAPGTVSQPIAPAAGLPPAPNPPSPQTPTHQTPGHQTPAPGSESGSGDHRPAPPQPQPPTHQQPAPAHYQPPHQPTHDHTQPQPHTQPPPVGPQSAPGWPGQPSPMPQGYVSIPQQAPPSTNRLPLWLAVGVGTLAILGGLVWVATRGDDPGTAQPFTNTDSTSGDPSGSGVLDGSSSTTSTTAFETSTSTESTTTTSALPTHPARSPLFSNVPALNPELPPYVGYKTVEDGSESFVFRAPTDWIDELPTPGQVIVSPDNNSLLALNPIEGALVFGAQTGESADFWTENIMGLALDELTSEDENCEQVSREPFQDGPFTGLIQVEDCYEGAVVGISIIALPPAKTSVFVLGFQLRDERDIAAVEEVLDSFQLFREDTLPPLELDF